MKLSPLQKKLLPEVTSIPTYETAVALFPLREAFVSEHLLPHPRFKSQILSCILAEYDVDLTGSAKPFDKEHLLQALLNSPLPEIIQGLGIAWNADAVAKVALQDDDAAREFLVGISRKEIQFALSFRRLKTTAQFDTVLDASTVEKDGLLCFASWISDIPPATHRLIEYACAREGFSFPSLERVSQNALEARQSMASRWCEQHIANQPDLTEETADAQDVPA
jgi:hypothetical protein